MKIPKINISHAKQALIESYLFAAIAGEVTYFIPKIFDALTGIPFVLNWAVVGYVAAGAVFAPLGRVIVAKYPKLSPFVNKLTSIIASKIPVVVMPQASTGSLTQVTVPALAIDETTPQIKPAG